MEMASPANHTIPNTIPLQQADEFIAGHAHLRGEHLHAVAGTEFLHGLKDTELTVLRQATLRAHRRAMGPRNPAPTLRELDMMIIAVGPFACENMLRKAIDEKRGGDTDTDFIDKAKRI